MEFLAPFIPRRLGYAGFGTRLRTLRRGANARQTDAMKRRDEPHHLPRNFRRRPRWVIAGEGMLVARKSFTWQWQRYKAGITRVNPAHPVCDSDYAVLLKPAYERESSPAVPRFLERRLAERSRPARWRRGSELWRLGGEYWRLGTRQSWRLG